MIEGVFKEDKDMLRTLDFIYKKALGIAFSAPPTLDRVEFMQKCEDFLIKHDFKDGEMHTIGNIDNESIRKFTYEMLK